VPKAKASGKQKAKNKKSSPPKEDDHEPIQDPNRDHDDDDENAGEGDNQESEPRASGEAEKVPKKRPAASVPTKKPARKGRKCDEDCAPYSKQGSLVFFSSVTRLSSPPKN